MQIIIPMAGSGKRFTTAGHKTIKPLIVVDGKPIIEYVINLFPGEDNFLFICNKEHLQNTELKNILLKLKPQASIVGIDPHQLGPVHSVMLAKESILDDEQAIINYCDFDMTWDYKNFKTQVNHSNADGIVITYAGFHPHLLGPNFYAGVKTDSAGNILEIKEKYSFSPNKMQAWHSNGTYYFKSGEIVKKYFQKLLDGPAHDNGEYYSSMPYNLMIQDGLKNIIYPIDYFCQWGTPEDLTEYKTWIQRATDNYQPTNETEEQILNYWKKFIKLKS